MIYLSGAIRPEIAGDARFGYMRTPNMGNRVDPAETWAGDNGCFSSKGERAFDLTRYLGWLFKQNAETCLFATAPDKVGDAAETLNRSIPVLPGLRQLGYKAALVAQDGLEMLPVPWIAFDVLFIGGTTDWKMSSAATSLVQQAKEQGKWVHMGRVNSYKRFKHSADIGCDSVDGTFLAFGPQKNLPRLLSWFTKYEKETKLYDETNSLFGRTDQCLLRLGGEGLAVDGEGTVI